MWPFYRDYIYLTFLCPSCGVSHLCRIYDEEFRIDIFEVNVVEKLMMEAKIS